MNEPSEKEKPMKPMGNAFKARAEELANDEKDVNEIIKQYSPTLYERAQDKFEKKLREDVLGRIKCPLIGHKTWDCSMMGLRKGQEAWCTTIEHINCPSYQAHVDYWIQKRKEQARRKKP